METTNQTEISGAKVASILALVLAIASFLVPLIGVLYLAPLAIVAACIGLWKGDFKHLSLVAAAVVIINYIVSPTFWLNIGAGAVYDGASGNRFLTWFGLIGSVVMIGLIVRLFLKKSSS